jgi:hypothetical protein
VGLLYWAHLFSFLGAKSRTKVKYIPSFLIKKFATFWTQILVGSIFKNNNNKMFGQVIGTYPHLLLNLSWDVATDKTSEI